MKWSDEELAALVACYSGQKLRGEVRLAEFAQAIGRSKHNVCRKARELGLTNKNRKVRKTPRVRAKWATDEERRASQSRRMKQWIAENGHPRGALGMRHSEETKLALADKTAASMAALTQQQLADRNMKAMRTKQANGTYVPNTKHGSWKSGWREIGGVQKYYRSKWEANYARYLQWLKDGGHISDWKHEPTTFWFDGIKRGCCSYLPDFWVQECDGSESYHEVKGWMDSRSRTKIRRMAKYHPAVRLEVIDAKRYAAIRKSVCGMVPGWEP